jgi:predicted flap endonuclease-1-like 5' DNA nuclease
LQIEELGKTNMRLDYPLYGLALVLFALTVITLTLVSEQDARLTYAVSTAAVGLLAIGGGYFLRPKTTVATPVQTASPTPQITAAEPTQQTAVPVVENPSIDAQIVEAPKIETSIVEVSPIQTTLAVEAPKIEYPAVVSAVVVEAQPAAHVVEPTVDVSVEKAEISAPAVETSQAASATSKLAFTQIRGISEKRAEQLKANGINTIEELANASAVDLAVKLNVSPKIVKMWIGSAKKLSK